MTTLEKLEQIVEEIEAMEPAKDCEAYVKRELLETLDKAHEMLASLAHDLPGPPGQDTKPAAG